MPLGTSRGAPPFNRFGVLLGQGAGAPPVSTAAGVANSILYVPANNARPIWTTSPTFTGNVVLNYAYVNGRLDVTPPAGVSNAIRIMPNADDSATGRLVFRELEANGTQNVTLRAPDALAGNVHFELPGAYGAKGDVLLTDEAGGWFFDTAPDRFNWTFNSDFEIWGNGPNAPPTGWAYGGTGSVGRATLGIRGGQYIMMVTRTADAYYIAQQVAAIYPPVTQWMFHPVTFGCWVHATVPNAARVVISDGTQWPSNVHSGSGNWEWLTVTMNVQSTANQLQIFCWVDTINTTAYYDGACLVRGTSVQEWVPSGWRGRKAILQLDTGNQVPTVNPSYYGSRADVAEQNSGGFLTPFKGVARNFGVSCNGGLVATDTLRYQYSTDTSLAVSFGGAATAQNTTNEVELQRYWVLTVKTTDTSGLRHAASLEYEEIP